VAGLTEPLPLGDYMNKLRRMANNALHTIERNDKEEGTKNRDRQRSWWQGYRQCLDDVEDVVRQHDHEEGPR